MKKIQLANAFSKVLNEWLSTEDISEINRRNSTPEYYVFELCATHDFCDPNQAMIDAYKSIFGREPSVQNKKDNELINKAWDLAKKAGFQQIHPKRPDTLVKFYKETESEILAVFPQLNYNKRLYGNTQKVGYAHIGQHTTVHKDYIKLLKPAVFSEYNPLRFELIAQGYTNLKILNEN